MAYLSLFLTALAAATVLPLSSEALMLALLQQGFSPALLWLVATTGNTLGSVVNWGMGRYLQHFLHLRWQQQRWVPVKPAQLATAQRLFQRYGVWSLLFAWLPVVGDALTLAAGILRVNFPVFVILIAIGKGARYGVLLWLAEKASAG